MVLVKKRHTQTSSLNIKKERKENSYYYYNKYQYKCLIDKRAPVNNLITYQRIFISKKGSSAHSSSNPSSSSVSFSSTYCITHLKNVCFLLFANHQVQKMNLSLLDDYFWRKSLQLPNKLSWWWGIFKILTSLLFFGEKCNNIRNVIFPKIM